jgi:D-serine deaminase-like pyridoxal phosphate-dependent protein
MDHSLEHHRSYIGRPALDLPTPSLVLSKHILEENIKKLHEDVTRLGIDFRPHTKTLKVSFFTFALRQV